MVIKIDTEKPLPALSTPPPPSYVPIPPPYDFSTYTPEPEPSSPGPESSSSGPEPSSSGPSSSIPNGVGDGFVRDPKDAEKHASPPPTPSLPRPTPGPSPTFSRRSNVPIFFPPTPTPSKKKSSFFSFVRRAGNNTSKRDIQKFVKTVVHGLVHENPSGGGSEGSDDSALLSLRSCAEACQREKISFAELLQDKFISDHTPIYWAIIRRDRQTLPMIEFVDDPTGMTSITRYPDLVTSLLSFSRPLSQVIIDEIREACLPNSDQILFDRLHLLPEFQSLTEADKLLLNGGALRNRITVEDLPGDAGEFAVDLAVVQFRSRMRISKKIEVQFVARARLWQLLFFVVPDSGSDWKSMKRGSWCVALSLVASTSATYVDSNLSLLEPASRNSLSKRSPTFSNKATPVPQVTPFSSQPQTITAVRLKSDKKLAAPVAGKVPGGMKKKIAVMLDVNLQHSGTRYIAADETLYARFEARLAKPDNDCVIC